MGGRMRAGVQTKGARQSKVSPATVSQFVTPELTFLLHGLYQAV